MNPRPSWRQRFLRLAREWSQYSTCVRSQVGAVLYEPGSKAVISIGYNDTPLEFDDCGEGGCVACGEGEGRPRDTDACVCVHAEANAVALAARRGVQTGGAHIAVTRKPCNGCRKLLIQAGVLHVEGEDFSETLGA